MGFEPPNMYLLVVGLTGRPNGINDLGPLLSEAAQDGLVGARIALRR